VSARLRRDDAGQIGGWEVIPFGILIFVVGTLLLINVWAVVDTRLAVGEAAREGAQAFVHESSEQSARNEARRAALGSLRGHGVASATATVDPVRVTPRFERCARVTVTVHATVAAIVLPYIGGFGHAFTVTGTQHDLMDPFRSDLPAESACGD
jgi:hypothetical protein